MTEKYSETLVAVFESGGYCASTKDGCWSAEDARKKIQEWHEADVLGPRWEVPIKICRVPYEDFIKLSGRPQDLPGENGWEVYFR